MSKQFISAGIMLLVQDGKIAAVGPNIPIPKGATVIEGKGLSAYPGMIDPHTSIGLTEDLRSRLGRYDDAPSRSSWLANMPSA